MVPGGQISFSQLVKPCRLRYLVNQRQAQHQRCDRHPASRLYLELPLPPPHRGTGWQYSGQAVSGDRAALLVADPKANLSAVQNIALTDDRVSFPAWSTS